MKTTLAEKLKEGPLPLKRALTIALSLADSIKDLHAKNQIHGCISTESVKILPRGGIELDYEVLEPEKITDTSYQETLKCTHVASIPSEVWQTRYWSKSSDIFGLGATLYNMITGKSIFEADSPRDFIALIIYSEIVPPITYNKDVPLWLNTLVMRMLSNQREDRPASIDEVIKTIQSRDNENAKVRSVTASRMNKTEARIRAQNKSGNRQTSKLKRSSVTRGNPEGVFESGLSKFLTICLCIALSTGLIQSIWLFSIDLKRMLMSIPYPLYFVWPLLPLIAAAPALSIAPLIIRPHRRSLSSILRAWIFLILVASTLGIANYTCNVLGYGAFNYISRPAMDHFDLITLTKVTLSQFVHMMCLSPMNVEQIILPKVTLTLEPNPYSILAFPSMYPLLVIIAALGIFMACSWNEKYKHSSIHPGFFLLPISLEMVAALFLKVGFSGRLPVTIGQIEIFETTLSFSYVGLSLGLLNYTVIFIACTARYITHGREA